MNKPVVVTQNRAPIMASEAVPRRNMASQIARILERGNLPELSNAQKKQALKAIGRAERVGWQTKELESSAQESALGFLASVDNQLETQSQHHLRELEFACNLNTSLAVISLVRALDPKVKPFAVAENVTESFSVQGHGYVWGLEELSRSQVTVPPEHLGKLSVVKRDGLKPDSIFVAVPYAETKKPLSHVLGDIAMKHVNLAGRIAGGALIVAGTALEAFGELDLLEDPLLIAGYGISPVVLVEIGRWE